MASDVGDKLGFYHNKIFLIWLHAAWPHTLAVNWQALLPIIMMKKTISHDQAKPVFS